MAEEGGSGQRVRRVVVADDDADIVYILTFNLEAAGYLPVAKERAVVDPVVRDALMLNDNFYLFRLQEGDG